MNKAEIMKCAYAMLNEYSEKEWFKRRGLKSKKVFADIERFDTESVQGYFGKTKDTLYIVFRGSEDDEPGCPDWKANFNFIPITLNIKTNIKVHQGFLLYYKKVKDKILKEAKKHKRIVVTGHSLGSALATLTAENIKFLYPDKKVLCLPFSSPMVGNDKFCEHFNGIIDYCLRIWTGQDTVVRVPPWLLGYRHVKEGKWLPIRAWWNPLRWILTITSWPLDHYPDIDVKECEKQL